MRLQCKVQVHLEGRASHSLNGTGCVSLGKCPKDKKFNLHVSTKKNKAGQKFLVENNVKPCHDRFISEGKLTISFIKPSAQLFINTKDTGNLSMFLRMIRSIQNGGGVEGELKVGEMRKIKSRHLEPVKRSLTVTSRKEYPDLEGFPKSLESLFVYGFGLGKVDARWSKLTNLQIIRLNNNDFGNKINGIQWSSLTKLKQIDISFNGIENLSRNFWYGLPPSVTILNLAGNSIRSIATGIQKLVLLNTLNLSGNRLEYLPSDLGHLQRLQVVELQRNKLSFIPACLVTMRLLQLDVSGNPFQGVELPEHQEQGPGTLQELMIKFIHDRRISTQTLPKRLAANFASIPLCDLCRKACVPSTIISIQLNYDLRRCTSTVVSSDESSKAVPVLCTCCSPKCARDSKML